MRMISQAGAAVFFFLLALQPVAGRDTNLIAVALFEDAGVSGKGVPAVTQFLTQTEDIKVTRVKGSDVAGGILKEFDVVIFTGGSGSKQGAALGPKGREEVQRFVREGGGYVGICAGAYLACSGFDWGLGLLNAKTISPKWQRGRGKVEMELTPSGEKVLGLPGGKSGVLYANGPIIEPYGRADLAAYESVALFRTELAMNGTPAGIMVNSPAIVIGDFGQGRVLASSPHPEQTSGLEHFVEAAVRAVARQSRSQKTSVPKVSAEAR